MKVVKEAERKSCEVRPAPAGAIAQPMRPCGRARQGRVISFVPLTEVAARDLLRAAEAERRRESRMEAREAGCTAVTQLYGRDRRERRERFGVLFGRCRRSCGGADFCCRGSCLLMLTLLPTVCFGADNG